jgi:hypothetical protein
VTTASTAGLSAAPPANGLYAATKLVQSFCPRPSA